MEESTAEIGTHTTQIRRHRVGKILGDLLSALGDERAAEYTAAFRESADAGRIAMAHETIDGQTNMKAASQTVFKFTEPNTFIPNSLVGGI